MVAGHDFQRFLLKKKKCYVYLHKTKRLKTVMNLEKYKVRCDHSCKYAKNESYHLNRVKNSPV